MRVDQKLDGVLQHVPRLDIRYGGDCTQAIGLDLPIVAINLPQRTDRWQALSSRMSAVGLDKIVQAPGVYGADLSDGDVAAVLQETTPGRDDDLRSHLTLSRPAIGCFLSHVAVWRWVIESGLPRVLVFEDDTTPTAAFEAGQFRRVVSSIGKGTDLAFLGRTIMDGLADRTDGADLARIYYFTGLFAYLITPAACRTLLGLIMPPRAHIDHQLSAIFIAERHAFPAYYSGTRFFEQDWSLRSDIYIPLADETMADRELGQLLVANRQLLLAEGRPLLPQIG